MWSLHLLLSTFPRGRKIKEEHENLLGRGWVGEISRKSRPGAMGRTHTHKMNPQHQGGGHPLIQAGRSTTGMPAHLCVSPHLAWPRQRESGSPHIQVKTCSYQERQAGPRRSRRPSSQGTSQTSPKPGFSSTFKTPRKNAHLKSLRAESGPPEGYVSGMHAIPKAWTSLWCTRMSNSRLWFISTWDSMMYLSPGLHNGQGSWGESSLHRWERTEQPQMRISKNTLCVGANKLKMSKEAHTKCVTHPQVK